MSRKKYIIGRSDIADFPELNLKNISVKIDTGAFTSSIHCHHIRVEKLDNQSVLKFNLLDPEHPLYHEKEFQVIDFNQKIVKNSFGESEERFIISTEILLFGETYPIDLSLTNRGTMKFPVLLGRRLLERFLVDVSKQNISYKLKQR